MKVSHYSIQILLRELGKRLGYHTKIEYKIGNEKIDVVWKNEEGMITFEIDLSENIGQILKNYFKYLELKKQVKVCKGNMERAEENLKDHLEEEI